MNNATQKPESRKSRNRKPRLALMGEFSAGKSTLSNLLLGSDPLPVQVTATRLPPIWISYGESSAVCEGLDGTTTPIETADLNGVDLESTLLIRLRLKSDILKVCDLIDMPGISDPNMQPDVWRAVIGQADHVVWCTHATQAWRQSEAAVWESLSDDLKDKSLLLLTRFDKLVTPRDRDRVLARVTRETKGLFHGVFPVSLTQALSAGDDTLAWRRSGAEPFVESLIDLLVTPDAAPCAAPGADRRKDDLTGAPTPTPTPAPTQAPTQVDPSSEAGITPSRVKPKPGGQRRARCTPGAVPAGFDKSHVTEIPGYA